MPLEIPIWRAAVTRAEAVPSISLGTEPMTTLLLGGVKIPKPIPVRITPMLILIYVGWAPRCPRTKSPIQSTVMPKAVRNLDPILSDSLPLIGEIANIGAACMAM